MKQLFFRIVMTAAVFLPTLLSAGVLRTARELASAMNDRRNGCAFGLEVQIILPPMARNSAFTAEDETGLVRLCDRRDDLARTLRAGDRVTVTGQTAPAPNSTFTIAACREIRFIRHEALPTAETVSAREFLRGACNGHRVTLRGVVRDVFSDDVDERNAFMIVDTGEGAVYATYHEPRDLSAALRDYVGCDVSLTGIGGSISPGSRRFPTRVFGLGTTNNIRIVKRPATGRFDAPDLAGWTTINPQEIATSGARRTEGTVVARWHGDTVLIKDATGRPVRIVCAGRSLPELNERIEAVGIPTTDLFNINLRRAIWRSRGPAAPATESERPRTSLALLFRSPAGYPLVRSQNHGSTLRIEGVVKALLTDENDNRKILLADGAETILVDCSCTPGIADRAAEGSRISVTGVCIMESADWSPSAAFPHVKGLFLVPRTVDDIKVLAPPPWWTPRRFLIVLGAMLALLVAILIWNASLRILVERRSRAVIRAQERKIESELRIAERTRLAAELHDSLAQNLTVIAYQTSAAQNLLGQADPKARGLLETVSKMLKSCRVDLRRCLWDLRSDVLDEPDFAEAIRKTTHPVAGDAKIGVRFAGPRARINDTTAHALLSILRELVANAVQHGHAKSIRIAGELRDRTIRFNVRDDGVGFDPARCPGPEDGHFGLGGIRERLRRLNGELSFEPNAPRGACAHIIINGL